MAARLPLFVLDTVLFPGTTRPFHIFEPRYRAMLADALAMDGRFGIILPGPDGTPPPSGAIGVVARVVQASHLPDGRSHVVTAGEERFILRGLVEGDTPYLVGRIEPFGDEEGVPELPGDLLASLRSFGARCRVAMATLTGTDNDAPFAEGLDLLTFQVAAMLPWSPAEAHPLLAIRSPAGRAEVLLQLLPRLVPELEERAAVHRRARTNGHGPHGGGAPQ